MWFQKVGEFFPFFGNFVQIKVKKPSKKKSKMENQKLLKTRIMSFPQ